MSNSKCELTVVFVLGSPGAGKGTQCKRISEEFGYVHLSAGDLLRRERTKTDSPYKECIDEHCRKGLMIPSNVTCMLLEKAISKSKSNKFLIDAFPPDLENLKGWMDSDLSKRTKLAFVLFLDCSQELCTDRILGRGTSGSGRDDDNPTKLVNRFNIFKKDSMSVIEHFQSQGLVKKVDTRDLPQNVYQEVRRHFLKVGEA